MLTFFTDPYEDELLYSAIARYHYYIGNIDFKDTIEELFNTRTVVASLTIPCNLNILVKKLGNTYTSDNLIINNTVFPFYSPFLLSYKKYELIDDIKNKNGIGVYNKIGICAGGICKKDGIYYCPICAKKDISNLGESYIHREHQLEGILVCPHDGAELKKYSKDKTISSRLEFIRFDEKLLDFTCTNNINESFHNNLFTLSKAAYYLLKTDFNNVNKESLIIKYKNILLQRGLATPNGSIKQDKLYEEFIDFYDKEFLSFMESDIDNTCEYNWLRTITRNCTRAIHPIRHLLFINFLTKDIEGFFSSFKDNFYPFGKGPWLCLNKASNHFNQPIVTDLKITPDYKTRVPVGTFTCSCGFIYSRKGPDKLESDKYKIGRIKQFGYQWENKLSQYLSSSYSTTKIADLMGCDKKTILKYKDSITSNSIKVPSEEKLNNSKLDLYKKCILNNKDNYTSRTELRKDFPKEYTYLYRHDKDWLFINLPKVTKIEIENKRVDWDLRDAELLYLLKENYNKLLNTEPPVRLSISYIQKTLKIKDYFIFNLDKLPKSKLYLNEICETVKEFQLRRCKKLIIDKLNNNEEIRLWEIQRLAGIRTETFNKIKDDLTDYIEIIQYKY